MKEWRKIKLRYFKFLLFVAIISSATLSVLAFIDKISKLWFIPSILIAVVSIIIEGYIMTVEELFEYYRYKNKDNIIDDVLKGEIVCVLDDENTWCSLYIKNGDLYFDSRNYGIYKVKLDRIDEIIDGLYNMGCEFYKNGGLVKVEIVDL